MNNKHRFQSLNAAILYLASQKGPLCAFFLFSLAAVFKSVFFSWSPSDFYLIGFFWLFRGVIEWAVHNYIHHANPLPIVGIRLYTSVYRMHIDHHINPHDLDSLLFGAAPVFFGSAMVFFLSSLLTFDLGIALTVTLSSILVLVSYEYVHFLSHVSVDGGGEVYSKIVRNHRLHHNSNPNKYMGVSSRLGDFIFGTSGC